MNVVRRLLTPTDGLRSLKDLSAGEHVDITDEIIREIYKQVQVIANPFSESEEGRLEAVRCLSLNSYFSGPAMSSLAGKQIPHIMDFMSQQDSSARAKVEILKALSLLSIHKDNRRAYNEKETIEFLCSYLVHPTHPIIARWISYLLCILCSDIVLIRKIHGVSHIAQAIYPLAFDNIPWNGWRHNYALRLFNLLGFDKNKVHEEIKIERIRQVRAAQEKEEYAHRERDKLSKGLERIQAAGSQVASFSRTAIRRLSYKPHFGRKQSVIEGRPSQPIETHMSAIPSESAVDRQQKRRNTTGTASSKTSYMDDDITISNEIR